jgi:GNAT superfamily N-acetyltransferase
MSTPHDPDRPEFDVREAETSDVEAVSALWIELTRLHAQLDPIWAAREGAQATYQQHLCRLMARPDATVQVAASTDLLVGYTAALVARPNPTIKRPPYGLLLDLMVAEAWRLRGVGTRLVRAIESWCRERGLGRLELNVATANPDALRFWRRLGFQGYSQLFFRELSTVTCQL